MEPTRIAARALQERGLLEILQRGQVLSLDTAFRGPIRLRLKRDDKLKR